MYPQTYPNDGGLIPLSCVNNIPVTYIMVVYIIINMYLIIFDHIRTTSRPIVFPVNNYCYSWYPRLYDFLWIPYYTIFNCSKKPISAFFFPPKKEENHIPTGKTPYGPKYFLNPAVIIPSHTFSEATAGSIWYLHTTVIIYIYIYMYRITI